MSGFSHGARVPKTASRSHPAHVPCCNFPPLSPSEFIRPLALVDTCGISTFWLLYTFTGQFWLEPLFLVLWGVPPQGDLGGNLIQPLGVKERSWGPLCLLLVLRRSGPWAHAGPATPWPQFRTGGSLEGGGICRVLQPFNAASCLHRRAGVRVPHGTARHPGARGAPAPARAPGQSIQHPVSHGPLVCTLWLVPPPKVAQSPQAFLRKSQLRGHVLSAAPCPQTPQTVEGQLLTPTWAAGVREPPYPLLQT